MKEFVESKFGRLIMILFVVAGIFLAMSVPDVIRLNTPRKNFNKMEVSEFNKNVMVEGEIYAAVGYVCEEYEKEKFTSKEKTLTLYYLIPVGEEEFIIFATGNSSQYDKIDEIVIDTYNYINGELNELSEKINVTGKVVEMDSEVLKYTKETLVSYKQEEDFVVPGLETEDEMEKNILPYMITYHTPESPYIMAGMGGGIFLLAVILLIIFIATNKNRKDTKLNYNNNMYQPQYPQYQPQYNEVPLNPEGRQNSQQSSQRNFNQPNNMQYNPINQPQQSQYFQPQQQFQQSQYFQPQQQPQQMIPPQGVPQGQPQQMNTPEIIAAPITEMEELDTTNLTIDYDNLH